MLKSILHNSVKEIFQNTPYNRLYSHETDLIWNFFLFIYLGNHNCGADSPLLCDSVEKGKEKGRGKGKRERQGKQKKGDWREGGGAEMGNLRFCPWVGASQHGEMIYTSIYSYTYGEKEREREGEIDRYIERETEREREGGKGKEREREGDIY